MMSNSSLQNAVAVTLISLIYLILIGCTIDINNFGTGIVPTPTFAKEVGTHQSSNKASSNQPSVSTSHPAKNNNSNQTIGNTINPPTSAVPITPPPSPVHPINNNTNLKNGTTSPPPSPPQTSNNTNTNKNMSNTIINQNTIKNSETIINEINNIIKTQQSTTAVSPTKEGPLVDLETVRLGNSTFPSGGIRPLADVSPFQIIGGHVSINSPSDNVNVIVAEITDEGVQHAAILDLKKTVSGIPGETLYHTDLGETITGTNPFTGKVDTISHITDLLLYNNNVANIQFNDDSGVTMTIIFR
jgi:hypothetical protein